MCDEEEVNGASVSVFGADVERARDALAVVVVNAKGDPGVLYLEGVKVFELEGQRKPLQVQRIGFS